MYDDDIPPVIMPLWAKALVVVVALPMPLILLMLMSVAPSAESAKVYMFLYPIATVLDCYCAWRCWANRRELYWILLALLVLTHFAMLWLTKI